MRTLLFTLLLVSFSSLFSQKFDVRFGMGPSFLGNGDMRSIMFENELNYFVNDYVSANASLAYGKSDNGVWLSASFIQANANLFLSPFKHTKKHDLRIGGGLSLNRISDTRITLVRYDINTGELLEEYEFGIRESAGLNLIAEYTFSISERFLVGIKALGQLYEDADSNEGILFKTGLRL